MRSRQNDILCKVIKTAHAPLIIWGVGGLCYSMHLCYTYSENTMRHGMFTKTQILNKLLKLLKIMVVHQCGGLKTTTVLIRTKTSVNVGKTKEKLHESS